MAGRDAKKLEQVRSELAARVNNPAVATVPILTADANDAPAVGRVLAQTQVVLSTAGPFARYGDNVVAQAVAQGTHYADITGEIPWVKRSVQKHHAAAKEKGVKILHCCGYDSIPSDMGTFMMVEYCRDKLGSGVSQAYSLIGPGRAGVSGGTLESGVNLISTEAASELAALNSNQYYLAELYGMPPGPDRPAGLLPRWLPAARTWAGPFIMEGCNAKIVQASHALLRDTAAPLEYGKDFKFTEMIAASGALGASLVSAGTVVVGAVLGLAPLRAVARRFLPAPGQGPSEDVQRNGFWSHDLVAVTDEAKPRVVRGKCGDRRDPGYWSTSRMLLETGLALSVDGPKLAADPRLATGGVLTAAAAGGHVLLERLRGAGFTFEVSGVEGEGGAK
ncbi:hypothetical protein HXX76_004847 [Chlamydomonas incerta]|uniref:Saccharopine dehydrogenase NADP binding domain-containing protein n=1 Tax=Chlamydomonas incerta TaxID=51695 RepID=A0A835T676_CHLIN|nr:hypothetical protein HXX76_004847 [Chlamydomonas incerta]|eukprot:KAG2439493.1 hypothetical protein HXX76_004847 [Chlamydomonas incerta]